MKINRNNYEPYFIDYLDGKLSLAEISELEDFLLLNLDLAAELKEFESNPIDAGVVKFSPKSSLQKSINDIEKINENNFDEFCIAHFEGDLNKKLEKLFVNYLNSSPSRVKIFNLYSKTFLKPETNIIFNKKSTLKRKTINVTRPIIYIISIAASFSLLFLVYKYFSVEKLTKLAGQKEIAIISVEPIKVNSNNYNARFAKDYKKIETPPVEISKRADSSDKRIPNLIALQNKIEFLQISGQTFLPKMPVNNPLEIASIQVPLEKTNHLAVNNFTFINIVKAYYTNIFDENKINLLGLAKSGINGFAKLTGINYDKDSVNNRIVYKFNSRLLSFYSSKENN